MCGIVGYAGNEQAAPILLKSLKKLEYRGYDSSGVAVLGKDGIDMQKAKGRLDALEKKTEFGKSLNGSVGIGHTRWATHGEPSDVNSHPHVSNNGQFAVVHNGIIENYLVLRAFLQERGFTFLSETDTEVIALLVEYYFNGDMIDTLRKVAGRLAGSYALGVLYAGTPDVFYALRKDSPLVVGLGDGANYIASDMPALIEHTRRFILLDDNEPTAVGAQKVTVYNANREEVEKTPFTVDWDVCAAEKDGYPHFMLKEIHEQPKALEKTVRPRIKEGEIVLDDVKLTVSGVRRLKKIFIVACGSAYHAGVVGKYFIEKVCRIPVETDLASEFRYRDPIIDENCLTLIVSQSGETADTLAALRAAKKAGSRTLSIVNVVGSSIARESDDVLYTWAGPEIAVATTKGYTSQVCALYLIGLYFARALGTLPPARYDELLKELTELPKKVEAVLNNSVEKIQYLSSLYFSADDAYFIGRGMDYAVALEGSLKLKEISYIHAEAYAAGELKHGTISLIEKGSLVVALSTDPALKEKTLSNVKEVRARGATVLAFASMRAAEIGQEADHVIYLPDCDPLFYPCVSAAALQLLSYYVSAARGYDIDKPRNLAKSVTVE